jgi:hypothetical protein
MLSHCIHVHWAEAAPVISTGARATAKTKIRIEKLGLFFGMEATPCGKFGRLSGS